MPDWVAEKTSVWPAPSETTAGTPARLAGLAPAVVQPRQPPLAHVSTASVPLAVRQKTSRFPPASTNGTGELAQLPFMVAHAVHEVLPLGASCRLVATDPPESVTKTSTAPPGVRMAAGSRTAVPGEPPPTGPPHSQLSGAPACCHACTIWPALLRANRVRAPSASAVTAGLLAILPGESPTGCVLDQPGVPAGC